MKKKTRTRNLKKISIICIIAILLSLLTQFVNCWNFTGITENIETGEKRVANMDMSLASYVWFPISEEGLQFRNYVANPALRYTEEFTSERYKEKELTEIKDALIAAEIMDEPKEYSGSEKLDGRKHEKVIDPYSTYYGALIEITDYKTDIFDKEFNNTYMSTLGPDHKLVKNYNETVKGIDEDELIYNSFINKIVVFPAILFIGAIAGIFVILLITLKKKKLLLAPGIIALAVGLLNIINLVTLPLFLLASVKSLVIFGVIYGITTLVGLTTLLGDIKAIKASKAE